LIEGQKYSWGQIDSYGITIPEVIGGGAALIVLFLLWERFQAEPLLPLNLFANRNFAVANWIAAAISFGMLSMFLPFTIYLQSARGFSALVAGLTLAPMSLTSMFTAPFAGRFADKVGGKYILMTGITLFTIGMASVALVAGPDSTWINFLVPAIIAGAGMGMTFAPMTTVAMRNIEPRIAGSASAVLNTIRQLGAVIGSAVVGALLQNQLATTLHNEAVSHAAALPVAFQDRFIAIFTNISSSGFQVGAGETGAKLPANIPPAVAHQLTSLAHDVFVSGYIEAMKNTLVLPIAFLAFTALTTLLIRRRPREAAQQQRPAEEVRAAAG
jgi:MFS family permease